jgi:hypothetical protein
MALGAKEIVGLVDRVRCAGGRRRNNAVTSQLLHSFFTASSQLLHSCNEPASSMHSPQL